MRSARRGAPSGGLRGCRFVARPPRTGGLPAGATATLVPDGGFLTGGGRDARTTHQRRAGRARGRWSPLRSTGRPGSCSAIGWGRGRWSWRRGCGACPGPLGRPTRPDRTVFGLARFLVERGRVVRGGGRSAFDACCGAVLQTSDRPTALDAAIAEMAGGCSSAPVIRRLGCLRGISTLTGFALAVEVGYRGRFTGSRSPRSWAWCPASTPREDPAPRADHQDRQRVLPPAAGRGGVALHHPLPPLGADPSQVGADQPGRAGPRPRGQPAAAPPVAELPAASQTQHRRQHRVWLVKRAGGDARIWSVFGGGRHLFTGAQRPGAKALVAGRWRRFSSD